MSQAFVHIIREMDSAYIKWAMARIKAARPKIPKTPRTGGKRAHIQY